MHSDPIGTPFQRVKRNIARASNHLNKNDFLKAVDAARTAFALVPACTTVVGQQKIELRFMLEEFCDKFSNTPGILLILSRMKMRARPYLKFVNGNHEMIASRLEIFGTRLEDMEREKVERHELQRDARRKELLDKGQQCLDSGETPRGKAYLRRVAEEFGDEPGVVTDVGKRMLAAELFPEAAEILEESRSRFPGDSEAYQHCVHAYLGMGEFAKAEAVYKDALRQFGNHPITLLNLSKLYLAWRKRDEAYDYARRALEADPSLDEARAIMDRTA
ncbi:tetratricopeptide (TPR) repeat protein [Desulfobaculum xiamenense]|uniref:Tetratricopeptide (TPR) repeat protein n=1 Tax=Desulfobaculum xiamenense TaxID=995050 RepID=A0A846QQY0_9BACT|nr:tetratricopeptide repeat protein [Desulfobaculum xiamenense]NJB69390.1 tetratricopeptide (TPR) repeat protein [Desulfobaculum xiamenense]